MVVKYYFNNYCMSVINGIGYVPKYRTYYDNYIKRFPEFLLFIASLLYILRHLQ